MGQCRRRHGRRGAGLLSQRIGLKPLTIGVMLLSTVMVILFGHAGANLNELSVLCALAGFFTNAGIVGLYAIYAQAFPTHVRATGTGVSIGLGRGGAALGPIAAGYLFNWGYTLPGVATYIALGSLLAAAVLALPATQRSAAVHHLVEERQQLIAAAPAQACHKPALIHLMDGPGPLHGGVAQRCQMKRRRTSIPGHGFAYRKSAPFQLIEQRHEVGFLNTEGGADFRLADPGIAGNESQHRELRGSQVDFLKGFEELAHRRHRSAAQGVAYVLGERSQVHVAAGVGFAARPGPCVLSWAFLLTRRTTRGYDT